MTSPSNGFDFLGTRGESKTKYRVEIQMEPPCESPEKPLAPPATLGAFLAGFAVGVVAAALLWMVTR